MPTKASASQNAMAKINRPAARGFAVIQAMVASSQWVGMARL